MNTQLSRPYNILPNNIIPNNIIPNNIIPNNIIPNNVLPNEILPNNSFPSDLISLCNRCITRAAVLAVAVAILQLAIVSGASAQKAEIKSTDPKYVVAGTTTTVSVFGEGLDPKTIAVSLGGTVKLIGSAATPDKMKGKGSKTTTLEITVPLTAPRDMMDINLVQTDGTKATTQIAVVDPATMETTVKKPASTYAQAMPIAGPSVAITGQLDGDTPDVFRLDAKAGETWRICLSAGRIGSQMDPVVRVRNTQHISLAISAGAKKKDRVILFHAAANGPYYIELTEAEAKGGDGFNYRLVIIKQ